MSRVTEYKLVQSSRMAEFNKQVTVNLRKGWELEGGVSATYNTTNKTIVYVQALSKEVIDVSFN